MARNLLLRPGMHAVTARLLSHVVVVVAAVLALLTLAIPGRVDGGAATCGDGVLDLPEQCDDGNVLPADGCSPVCTFEVLPNLPPNCAAAMANAPQLWPPNHRLEAVHILGIDDPDLDPVDVTITAITQNEPTVARGSGDTCPDAEGVGTGTALVRVERAGPGDGRVYRIHFTADDHRGGVCDGAVTVCVPHDRGRGSACGAGGDEYDSMEGCALFDACNPVACIPAPEAVAPAACVGDPLPRRVERLVNRARAFDLHDAVPGRSWPGRRTRGRVARRGSSDVRRGRSGGRRAGWRACPHGG